MKNKRSTFFLRYFYAVLFALYSGIPAYSEPLPARSGGRLPPYPDKYINVAGHTVVYDNDLPENVSNELRAKKENAVDDIVAVYEQIDWSLYGDAACLDKFLIGQLNDIMYAEIKSNKKARLKVGDILDKNPASNAKWILIALVQNAQIKDADLVPAIIHFSTDTDKSIRYEVIRFLLNQKDPQCLPHLKKILSTEQDKNLRVLAAEALAALDDRSGYDEISKAIDDKDVNVRISAYRSLGELKTAKARVLAEQAIIKAGRIETNPGAKDMIANSLRLITGQPINEINAKYFGIKLE